MRVFFLTVLVLAGIAAPALAQNTGTPSVPAEIGNRANGNDYEPTPNEVVPREKAAGISPSEAQEKQTNQELWRLDSNLLKSEGLSTRSVPNSGAANRQ